jgi:hypothetical protein
MTDGNRQAKSIADLDLQTLLPDASLMPIAAAGVSQQQEMVGAEVGRLTFGLPPVGDRVDGERRCVTRCIQERRTHDWWRGRRRRKAQPA